MTGSTRQIMLAGLCLLAGLLCGMLTLFSASRAHPAAAERERFLLIDPGHGGRDGGAVGADGGLEKNLNLSVALQLRDMLRVLGIPVRMTRETDCSIGDAESAGWKKSDMLARLELYRQAETVISIHQNHFSQSQYQGAQMFYSTHEPDSRRLAECLRASVVGWLQPENKRELKPATDGIFLLRHAPCPTVLVECGFLSNPQEYALLQAKDYQQKLAFSVCAGYLRYISSEGAEFSWPEN